MITSGDVAVVTGGAGGIGLGLARACARRDMAVVIADLDPQRLAEAVDGLRADGATASAVTADVRDPAQVESLRDHALEAHGRIDLVCNNAGVGLSRPVLDCTDADWDLLLAVNLNGVINGVRTFLPLLVEQGSGHMSTTASLSGLVGDPDLSVYATTKFAAVGLMESLQQEMRRDHPGISMSVLCPGPVATDLMSTSAKALDAVGAEPSNDAEAVADYLARGMHPDDVGRAALDGIAEGRFWLLPHDELTIDLLTQRLDGMRTGTLAVAEDDWTDQG